MSLPAKTSQIAFLLCLACLSLSRSSAQSLPQWGNLKPGAYGVGFRHVQKYDYARQVKPATDFSGVATVETAYPIQIGIWYPAVKAAQKTPMTFEELQLLALKRERFTPVSPEDRESVRNEIKATAASAEVTAAISDDLVRQILATRTAAYQNARPAPGRFPVVLVGGYTLTAASVLCEYLASQGYVVLVAPTTEAAATQQTSKPQFALNDRVRAFEYLAAEAQTLPFVDPGKLAVIGLNFDGMSALLYQMQNMRAAAVVSINGWETIRPNNEPLFAAPYLNRLKMRVPYLNFHWDQPNTQPADLRLLDSLKYSERFHFVVAGLDHFGLIVNPLAYPFSGTQRKAGYEFLAQSVAHFLDRYLKGNVSAEQFLRNPPEAAGAPAVSLKTAWQQPALPPVPYDAEFAQILWEQKDLARAAKILREARAANPAVQLFGEHELNVYAFRFNRMGRHADALAVRELVAEAYPNSFTALMNLAEALFRVGRHAESEGYYDKAGEIGAGQSVGNRGAAYFNLGCGYSLLGKKEKTLAALEKAISEGFTNRRNYETDEDLAPLRAEARFQELLTRLPK